VPLFASVGLGLVILVLVLRICLVLFKSLTVTYYCCF